MVGALVRFRHWERWTVEVWSPDGLAHTQQYDSRRGAQSAAAWFDVDLWNLAVFIIPPQEQ